MKFLESFCKLLLLVVFFLATFWRAILWTILGMVFLAVLFYFFGEIVLWVAGVIIVITITGVGLVIWALSRARDAYVVEDSNR